MTTATLDDTGQVQVHVTGTAALLFTRATVDPTAMPPSEETRRELTGILLRATRREDSTVRELGPREQWRRRSRTLALDVGCWVSRRAGGRGDARARAPLPNQEAPAEPAGGMRMAGTDVGRLEQDVGEIKADVRRLAGDIDELKGDVRELKGGFAQMNERIGSLESLQRWALGMYGVLILAVLGLYFKASL